jgi:hypothetical protein
MIDGGAPYISLAQSEFEQAAISLQKVAHEAAEKAAYYVALAQAMQDAYRQALANAGHEQDGAVAKAPVGQTPDMK